jgi:hypothetical protein
MPPVIAAVAAMTALEIAVYAALIFIAVATAKLASKKTFGLGSEARDRAVVIRSASEPHRILYGRCIIAGPLAYFERDDADSSLIHLIVLLTGHEVSAIRRVWFDDVVVGTLDGSGDVTSGKFTGHARIVKHLGSTSQTADAALVAASAGAWTTDDKLQGISYVYVRLKRNDDIFPTGIPNIRCEVDGKAVYDPRDAGTRWTMNPALIARDVLTSEWGLDCDSSEIDDATVVAAANVCDETVTVNVYTSPAVTVDNTTDTLTFASRETQIGTGDGVQIVSSGTYPGNLSAATTYYAIRTGETTVQLATTYADALAATPRDISSNGSGTITLSHINQRRFTANGTFTRATDPREMLSQIQESMIGRTIYQEGVWRIHAGAWATPTVTLTEADLRGPVTLQPRTTRQDLFNAVRGTYAPSYNAQMVDFPMVTDAGYETEDGGVQIAKDVEFPFLDNAVRAQRLAKLVLERARRPEVLILRCNLRAFRLRTWDTVYVTISLLGYSAKTFRILDWELSADDGVLGVNLTMQAEDSTVFSWTATDATDPAIPPDLVLPTPRDVVAPTSIVMSSGNTELVRGTDGSIVSRIKVSWTAAAETNLTQYELQYKKSSESDYVTVSMPGDSLAYYVAPVADGVNYDVRVRSLAGRSRSAWLTGTHTVLGKSDLPTAPTSLAVTSATGGFDILWDVSTDVDYYATEVWEHTSNDRTGATKLTEVSANRLARSGLAGGATRYYWVRNLDTTGNLSTWYPVSSTGGISATTGSTGNTLQITHDSTSYLAGGATNYLTGTGYWLGYHSGAYKMHLGNPSGAYMAWDGSALTVNGSVFAGDITISTTGNIRGGQTAYNTGTGFFLGYTSSAYKFSIGNPSGEHLLWTGTNLVINGATVKGGQTAYNTGTGFWMGYDSGAWKFSIGDASGNLMTFDGTSFTTAGSAFGGEDTRTFAAGTKIVAASARAGRVYAAASPTYYKTKAVRMARAGTVTVVFALGNFNGTGTVYGKIYKNGSAVGTERTRSGSVGWTTQSSENFSISAGDTLELWVKADPDDAFCANFFVMADDEFDSVEIYDFGTTYDAGTHYPMAAPP